jgi:DNA-binding PadR family transcriptional regulator
MEKTEVKEGILCLLEDRRGRTLEEIQEFLKDNNVAGYFGDDSEAALQSLLDDMREEGLIEQRFMEDGADTADFAIEDDGLELLKSMNGTRKRWNTGRPEIPEGQMMKNLEDME